MHTSFQIHDNTICVICQEHDLCTIPSSFAGLPVSQTIRCAPALSRGKNAPHEVGWEHPCHRSLKGSLLPGVAQRATPGCRPPHLKPPCDGSLWLGQYQAHRPGGASGAPSFRQAILACLAWHAGIFVTGEASKGNLVSSSGGRSSADSLVVSCGGFLRGVVEWTLTWFLPFWKCFLRTIMGRSPFWARVRLF